MGDAILALIVMTLIGAGFVGLMILINKRHNRIREERRQRWAAMGYGETGVVGGGAAYGGACAGGTGGGCAASGCSGSGGCGGGGGGGCGGGGGG